MLKTTLRVLKVSLGLSPILRESKDKQIQTLPTAGATHHSHHEMAILRNLAEVGTALLELCYVWLLRQFEIVTTTGSRRVDVVFDV